MPSIQVLPPLLVNKIAAGEVIERPASVVKELVENSLDAGATRIEVTIDQGGRKLIRVVDNGGGMDPEDLQQCIQPHATSKIRQEEDLFNIATMGFRGEALPSVGAVSQMRIVSRRADADEAYEIRLTGSTVEPIAAVAGPPGTAIEVRELFFNVPARQKFLRTPQTEMGHITEQVARIALVHPEVEFRLTHNGRLVHHLRPADGMRPRIADFYGKELADILLTIDREERGVRIHGYVAPPSESRSSNKWQYFFLNGRYIRDRFIAHAVREAYRGLIMEGNRHPVAFLSIEVDPAAVDVNVHPTKIEVRWRDANALYSQMLSALRDRFLTSDLTHTWQTGPGEESRSEESVATPDEDVRRQQIRQSIADYFRKARPMTGDSPPAFTPPPPRTGGTGHLPTSATGGTGGLPTGADITPSGDLPILGDLIQIHRSYIAAETSEGMIIVDQHALHERILFERLSEEIARGPLESQRLLIPETLDISGDQISIIEIHADVLKQLGFELTPYGPTTIAVHACPSLLKQDRVLGFVRDLMDRLSAQDTPTTPEMLTNDLLSMMACKAAVKAGDPLTPEEMRELMAQRDRVERSTNCPHGRPTSLRFTLTDLEKQFKRT
jgi:DNA mismatch repair protein MutL